MTIVVVEVAADVAISNVWELRLDAVHLGRMLPERRFPRRRAPCARRQAKRIGGLEGAGAGRLEKR